MTAEITFYNLGNADSSLIKLADDKLILIDFADMRDANNRDDVRCDLPRELRKALYSAEKDEFDVVCFTHLDKDHIYGMKDFFELRYKKETQGIDRPRIKELWVPAAAITEEGQQVKEDAWAIRQEARHRLKEGEGIKVFSRPEDLKAFLESNGISPESRKDCIVDAGQTIPGFTLTGSSKVEFFLHCPFAWRADERDEVCRNEDSVVFQACFNEDGVLTRGLFGADVDSETLSQIVKSTKKHSNEDRLLWDILKLFHHCSYKALNKEEKGEDETIPVENVKWLIEDRGQHRCRVISPSEPIPDKGSKEDKNDQPPHRQAAKYYERICSNKSGEFKVTMAHPNKATPRPLKIEITRTGARIVTIISSGISSSVDRTTRQG